MRDWKESAKDADNWQQKGDAGWELGSRLEAVLAALYQAVRMPLDNGLAWLSQSGVAAQLDRIVELEKASNRRENNVVAADLADVLGKFDIARELLALCPKLQPPLWAEYRSALLALLNHESYKVPQKLKAAGILATFVPHLKLAEALSSGGDGHDTVEAVDQAFAKRNSDKRVHDYLGVDGDGTVPVKWDLRKQSILAAARAST